MSLKTMINNWGISRKLTTLIALSAIVTGLATGVALTTIAKSNLTQLSQEELKGSNTLIGEKLKIYLGGIKDDLTAASLNPINLNILNQFNDSWNELADPKEYLQKIFVETNENPAGQKDKLIHAEDGTSYAAAHSFYHPQFLAQKDAKGYYDIFLINKKGDIVYSVYKELDYATNLQNGQWANSDLGKLFKAAKQNPEQGKTYFSDFAAYAPSNNVPASFMLSPILDEKGTFAGAIAFQLPIDRFNNIFNVSNKDTIAYVVGTDGILRSNITQTTEDDILTTPAKIQNLKDFLGKTIEDQPGLGFEHSLYAVNKINFEGVEWLGVQEMNMQHITDKVFSMNLFSFIFSSVTSLLVAIFGFYMSRKISHPLAELAITVDKLSKGYAVEVPCKDHGDEIGSLARSMETIHQRAVESARVENAVEESRSSLMIADTKGKIIYANKTVRTKLEQSRGYIQGNMAKISLSNLETCYLADFHGYKSEELKNMLTNLKEAHHCELQFDNRYFDSAIRPVHDKSGNHVGFVSEWREKTGEVLAAQESDRIRANEERVEAEIAEVIQNAATGNFRMKLNTTHDRQFIRSVSEGINQICEAVNDFFEELNEVVSNFAEGDLTKSLRGHYSGQFDDVKNNLNGSFKTLSDTIKQIAVVGNGIRAASSDITQGADDLSSRTESQAASIEETVATMEEISASVRNNANSAVQAANLASGTLSQAEEGSRVVAQAVTAMQSLENSSHRIAEIVSVIDSIASQTNLLALNAAVEAARAGEAGKGFAVVASEVRTLASRCSEAARDIRGLIAGSNAQVTDGVKLVNATGNALRLIVESVNEVSQTIASISAASREQATGVEEISGAISQMDEMTQQNAALSDESAAAARSLAKEAEHLATMIRNFKTEDVGSMLASVSKDMKEVKKDFGTDFGKDFGTGLGGAKKAGGGTKDAFDDFGNFGMASGDDWADL